MLVACDIYRPAAIEQLEVLANQINVPIFKDIDQKDPVVIANDAIELSMAPNCPSKKCDA